MTSRHSHRSVPVRLLVLLLAVLALGGPALANPRPAIAGEFTISTCQANGEYASGAFENFATRGMKWRRACNPLGPGLRGLVTANAAGTGHVPVGSQSAFVLEAPPETTFSDLHWSGYAHRRDCRYALQLYAVRPEGTTVPIKNVRADRGCPRPDEAQASSWPRPRAVGLGGAAKIVQRVVCVGAPKAEYCSAKGQNYLQTFTAEATVVDDVPPSVSITPGSPLVSGQWVRGTQTVGFEATDNTGIKEAHALVAGAPGEGESRQCDYSQRIPCPSGPGQVVLDTQQLSEGTQQLAVSAVDAAGNAAESAPVTVHIDNTPPGAVPVSVAGGDTWRNRDEFDLGWTNQPEPDRAPITAAHYKVCRVGTQECVAGTDASSSVSAIDGLTVPAPGEWEAQMWREDAAGNVQPENASVAVRLRYDPEPPTLGFEETQASDPDRVSVKVNDAISGVAGGEVEISKVGSGQWQVLPSTLEGEHLVSRIEDQAMPAGEYQLRASASDRAGNLASTESKIGGGEMRVTLPLRTPTSLSAGILHRHEVTRTVHRKGKARIVRRAVTGLEPKVTTEVGKKISLAGRLTDAAGDAIPGATVEVYATPPEEAEAQVATLTTGANGGFAYETKAATSADLRFAYAGTATTLPAESGAELLVHGHSSLKVNHTHVLNGHAVVFSGRVEGRPLPVAGKLLELQVRLSHEWSTFRTTRSAAHGTWRIRYPFKRTCGKQTFRFRVRLPAEAAWPLLAGESNSVDVHVRGAPCSG
ncbi:MAG: hypothetical protein JSU06_10225 [Actinobacteria bacterium]|nr:hypothetical protein [Actinomycetota bacterium]